MKFNKNDIVCHLAIGYNYKVVGTSLEPRKSKVNPYNNKEIYPEKGYDYLIMKEEISDNGEKSYKGIINAVENQLELVERFENN